MLQLAFVQIGDTEFVLLLGFGGIIVTLGVMILWLKALVKTIDSQNELTRRLMNELVKASSNKPDDAENARK